MWVCAGRTEFSAPQRLPNMRKPVPQSRMNWVPSGASRSRHGVFPPKRHVAGSTVGVEPRTPQKLNLAMGVLISVVAAADDPCKALRRMRGVVPFLIVAAAVGSVHEFA